VVEVTEGADALAATIAQRGWAASVGRGAEGAIEVTVTDVAAAQHEIPAMVSAQGVGLARMEAGEMGLEEVFVELVGGAVGNGVKS
jgi:ABC-2 type transport system ATP-binding protein